jgi:hypothetical protein
MPWRNSLCHQGSVAVRPELVEGLKQRFPIERLPCP